MILTFINESIGKLNQRWSHQWLFNNLYIFFIFVGYSFSKVLNFIFLFVGYNPYLA